MKTNSNRFWLIVILLGWGFDFLFWKKPVGISFFIYVLLLLGSGIYIMQSDGLRLSRRAAWILPLIVFFSAMTFLRLETMTLFFSVCMTFFLMGVLALTSSYLR